MQKILILLFFVVLLFLLSFEGNNFDENEIIVCPEQEIQLNAIYLRRTETKKRQKGMVCLSKDHIESDAYNQISKLEENEINKKKEPGRSTALNR